MGLIHDLESVADDLRHAGVEAIRHALDEDDARATTTDAGWDWVSDEAGSHHRTSPRDLATASCRLADRLPQTCEGHPLGLLT